MLPSPEEASQRQWEGLLSWSCPAGHRLTSFPLWAQGGVVPARPRGCGDWKPASALVFLLWWDPSCQEGSWGLDTGLSSGPWVPASPCCHFTGLAL